MKLITLTIDSSSKTAAAGLFDGETALYESFLHNGLTHSETLGLMLEDALRVTRVKPSDIGLVAVTIGPGSFTGLRIGAAAALGFALAARCEAVGVSSLEAAAYNALFYDGLICAVMDARRNQVYTASFEARGGVLTRLTEDSAANTELVVKNFSDKSVFMVGDGAKLCYNGEKDLFLPDSQFVRPRGILRCVLAGHSAPAHKLRYLRLPQAERERLAHS